jgi:prefoldin subunit 5
MAEATIDHLAQDVERLRESDRQLAVDVRELSKGLTGVQTELRLVWRIGGGVAALFASVLLWTAGQTFGLAGRVGELSAEVRSNAVQTKERFDQVEKSVNQRFDQLEKRMDKTDGKLDQVLQRLDQVVPKTVGGK